MILQYFLDWFLNFQELISVCLLQALFPWLSVNDVLCRLYPYQSLLPGEGRKAVEQVLSSFKVYPESMTLMKVTVDPGAFQTSATITSGASQATVQVSKHSDGRGQWQMALVLIYTDYVKNTISY